MISEIMTSEGKYFKAYDFLSTLTVKAPTNIYAVTQIPRAYQRIYPVTCDKPGQLKEDAQFKIIGTCSIKGSAYLLLWSTDVVSIGQTSYSSESAAFTMAIKLGDPNNNYTIS